MGSISNISIAIFRDYLRSLGLKCDRPKGGHEVWSKNNLRNIGKTRKEFEAFLKNTGNNLLGCE